ncbi:MAG: hypothetical protein BGWL_c3780 [Candidatus Phytoplasma cynodontis]|nr:MAG: hypothetical protein BGWL_c3780 [Candidatus Phytoplasma cynodontis]
MIFIWQWCLWLGTLIKTYAQLWCLSFATLWLDYFRGFTQAEILARRTDWFLTVCLTAMAMNGFRPGFTFLKNILVLIRKGINKVLNCCFKKRKYHLLIKKKRKQEAVIKELNQKIEDFLTSNPKLKRSLEEKVIISQEESLTPPTQKGEEENE